MDDDSNYDDDVSAPHELGSPGADDFSSPASAYTVGGTRFLGDVRDVDDGASELLLLEKQRARLRAAAARGSGSGEYTSNSGSGGASDLDAGAGGRSALGGAVPTRAAPPPAAPPLAAPPRSTVPTLNARIAAAGDELADVSERLGRAEAYAALVERRLLEIAPDLSLPVRERDLGAPVIKVSKLAAGAVVVGHATIVAGGAAAVGRGESPGKVGGGGAGGGDVGAGAAEASRRSARDAADALRAVDKELDAKRRHLDDAVARIRELRAALEVKEKERASAVRRADALASRLASAEAEARVAGAHAKAGAGGGAGHVPVTHAPTVQANDALVAQLRARAEFAERELSDARAAAKADTSARATRVAASIAASGNDSAHLHLRIATLVGEVEAHRRDGAARDAELELLRAGARAAKTPVRAPKGTSTANREGLIVNSPSLGPISLASHRVGAATGAASGVDRLEAEKAALLEYIAEHGEAADVAARTTSAKINALEAALARARVEADAQARAAAAAEKGSASAASAAVAARNAEAAALARAKEAEATAKAATARAGEDLYRVGEMLSPPFFLTPPFFSSPPSATRHRRA